MASSNRASVGGSNREAVCISVASSVEESRISRLSCASAGSEYLSLIVSPCSVSFIVASTVPYGVAMTASPAGPPPRPTDPPRGAPPAPARPAAPVEQPQPHAVLGRDVAQLPLRPLDLPLRRGDPG